MIIISQKIWGRVLAQRVIVGTWGANLAVRLPRDAAQRAGFVNGTPVEVEARRGEVVIRSIQPRYTLSELLEGATPEAMRDAFEWGEDVGREIVE
jgi:antitoxin MazE